MGRSWAAPSLAWAWMMRSAASSKPAHRPPTWTACRVPFGGGRGERVSRAVVSLVLEFMRNLVKGWRARRSAARDGEGPGRA